MRPTASTSTRYGTARRSQRRRTDPIDRCTCPAAARRRHHARGRRSTVQQHAENIGGNRGHVSLALKSPQKPFGRFHVTSQSSYLLALGEKIPTAEGIRREARAPWLPSPRVPEDQRRARDQWLYQQIAIADHATIHSTIENCRPRRRPGRARAEPDERPAIEEQAVGDGLAICRCCGRRTSITA